jgi:hypothetical protein
MLFVKGNGTMLAHLGLNASDPDARKAFLSRRFSRTPDSLTTSLAFWEFLHRLWGGPFARWS